MKDPVLPDPPGVPIGPDRMGPATGLPVVLSVEDARCLVVGGGPVAARRATALVRSGARVTVVAPEVDDVLLGVYAEAGPGRLEIARRAYVPGEAASYRLVVTATGVPGTDRAVVEDALAAGALVATADAEVRGNLQLPAVHREGPVTLAVSTGGSSPGLASWLRTRLAAALGPDTAALAALADEARHLLRRSGTPTGSVDWPALFDDTAGLLDAGRADDARELVLERCREAEGADRTARSTGRVAPPGHGSGCAERRAGGQAPGSVGSPP